MLTPKIGHMFCSEVRYQASYAKSIAPRSAAFYLLATGLAATAREAYPGPKGKAIAPILTWHPEDTNLGIWGLLWPTGPAGTLSGLAAHVCPPTPP